MSYFMRKNKRLGLGDVSFWGSNVNDDSRDETTVPVKTGASGGLMEGFGLSETLTNWISPSPGAAVGGAVGTSVSPVSQPPSSGGFFDKILDLASKGAGIAQNLTAGGQPKPVVVAPSTNYTPYLIGGGVLLVGAILLMKKKK